ncbi:MAG: sensor histidine kinase [Clostridia bacterium]|nr:sensor histidine kinase [Clostridia bacterium]
MKELSLNILDVAKNSTVAGATLVEISLVTDEKGFLTMTIRDDGCGMSEETVKNVSDPFYTTRKTRKVGLGLPLLRLAAESTGGTLEITSSQDPVSHGTTVKATFDTTHIDFAPVGDVVSSMVILIGGDPQCDFLFVDKTPEREVRLDTRELKAVLGGVSLAEFEVLEWIRAYLSQQYET